MRALLITEQRSLIRSVGRVLSAEGWNVESSPNTTACRPWLVDRPPDVTLLDAGSSADAALEQLQAWRREGLQALVLVIAAGEGPSAVQWLDAGADDCLKRPYLQEELVAHLRALARRVRLAGDRVLRIHDLEIDMVAHTARRAGRLIVLTPREFALLHLLASYRGRVVSRSLIMRKVYGERDLTHSNLIDVYIGYLRQKIDKGFDRRLIQTRRGQGYMLGDEDDMPARPRSAVV